MRWTTALRAAAVVTVAARLARGLAARPALARAAGDRRAAVPPLTVVVPARDEAERIGPLLRALTDAEGVVEVIVVDDGSSDATADVAAAAGARVLRGTEPPAGWTGKTWALVQGIGAAATDWIVTVDADVVPDRDLPRVAVARAIDDGDALLTLAGRAVLPPGARWLHAAMLTQLVYRFGPPGTGRRLANGQCMIGARATLLAGLGAVSGALVEDVALARHVAAEGGRVDLLDATGLMTVHPYDTVAGVWSSWGRSIGLRGVESRWRQAIEVLVLGLTLVVPPIRWARRSADAIDAVAVVLRVGTLAGTRRAYAAGGAAYWTSPLADPIALTAAVAGMVNPRPRWRGRVVVPPAGRSRTAGRRTSSGLR